MSRTPAPSRAVVRRAPARRDPVLRTDIQALRALAVVTVVLYHLWPDRLPGGYVGVDVFFVVSGFLITGHLAGELDRTGRVRLGRFWARRARRLVPAASLVLVATTLGTLVWAPLSQRHRYLSEVVASAVQVENWRLAHDATDYFAAINFRSPLLHFWSLSVEEQFYVVVPLVLVLTALATRRRPEARPWVIVAVLAAITLVSLLWSVRQTSTTPGVAYLSTLTRAWEFGLGALVATWPRRPRVRGRSASRARGALAQAWPWLGVSAILVACVVYSDETAFPGVLAAVPVLGAAVALATGRHTSLAAIGRWAPVALTGRASYAIYLWHFPLIVLLPYATGRPLSSADKVALLLVTAVVAVASTLLVEEPIRFRRSLLGGRRPRVVAVWCGGAVAIVMLVAVGGRAVGDHRTDRLEREVDEVLAGDTRCLGAAAMDPTLAPCVGPDRGDLLIPDPAVAIAAVDNYAGCWELSDGVIDVCHVGTLEGYDRKLLAVGDSHNNALLGAYRTLGQRRGWRIDVAGEGGCYVTTATQAQPSERDADDCRSWRQQVVRLARDGGYDGIVVTHSPWVRPVVAPPGVTRAQATVDGLVGAWEQLPDVPIIAIRDNPLPRPDVLGCVEDHRDDDDLGAHACGRSRAEALAVPDGQAEAARRVPRATVVDLTDLYCDRLTCPAVIGHVLVYRDVGHLTAAYVDTLEPYLERAVMAAMAG